MNALPIVLVIAALATITLGVVVLVVTLLQVYYTKHSAPLSRIFWLFQKYPESRAAVLAGHGNWSLMLTWVPKKED